jgi:hypothetical protein
MFLFKGYINIFLIMEVQEESVDLTKEIIEKAIKISFSI